MAGHRGIEPLSWDRRSRMLADAPMPRKLILLGGFEPPLQGSTVPCSTWLSYSKISDEKNTPDRTRTDVTESKARSACPLHYGSALMELVGLEPTPSVCNTEYLPFDITAPFFPILLFI